MNPCPCGFFGDSHHECRCTPNQIQQYRNRISGPLLDRIDLQIEVPRLSPAELERMPGGEDTQTVARRVHQARARQLDRDGCPAARLGVRRLKNRCALDEAGQELMRKATERLGLSARSWHRCLRVARTIADLNGDEQISAQQLAEAIGYREQMRA